MPTWFDLTKHMCERVTWSLKQTFRYWRCFNVYRWSITEEEIKSLIKFLKSDVEPKGPCCCIYKGRLKHCTTFSESNKDISEYSIQIDLRAIGKSKATLEKLIDAKIYDILDIPIDFTLPPKIKKQTKTHRLG